MAEHQGESNESLEKAIRAAAHKAGKGGSFKVSKIGGEISVNPGTINKFVVSIDVDD